MAKTKGLDVYLKVNTGTHASPVWTKIGGQSDATINPGRGKIEVTDKDSGGWEESIPGNRNFGVDCDCFLIEDDAGILEIFDAWIAAADSVMLELQVITKLKTYTGAFVFGKGGIKASEKDAAKFSFSLESTGVITIT
jgi:predicted secreted protein